MARFSNSPGPLLSEAISYAFGRSAASTPRLEPVPAGAKWFPRALALVCLVFALLVPVRAAHAGNSYTWSGQGDGSTFSDAANWSPSGVPTDGDVITVAQLPGGPAYVENTPSISLAQVNLGTGGHLYGAGVLTVDTFGWSGGTLGMDLTVTTEMSVSGTGSNNIKAANKTLLYPNQRVTLTTQGISNFLDDGELLLSYANWVNDGTANLGNALVSGGGCCVNPNQLVNHGTLSSAGATLQYLRLDETATGVISGGDLILDSGDHIVRGGSINAGADLKSQSSVVTLTGGVTTLGGTLTIDGSSEIWQAGTLQGTGLVRWLQGTIYATLTVNAPFEASGSGTKTVNSTPGRGGGTLVLQKASTVMPPAGSSLTLASAGGTVATLRNQGTLTLKSGSIMGAGCCTLAPVVNNVGTIVANPGAGNTVGLLNLAARSSGKITAKSGTLAFSGVAPSITGGTFTLGGGAVSVPSSTPLTLTGGKLAGSGTVHGPVTNTAGTVAPGGSAIGTLTVDAYQQASGATLAIQVATLTSADRLVVTGAAALGGTLAVTKKGTATVAPGTIPVLAAGSLTGTFAQVTGLGLLGSGWRVVYTSTGVRLVKP